MKYNFLLLGLLLTVPFCAMEQSLSKKAKFEKSDTSLLGKIPTDIKKIIFFKMLEKTADEEDEHEKLTKDKDTFFGMYKHEKKCFIKTLHGISKYRAHVQEFAQFNNLDTPSFITEFIESPPSYYGQAKEIKSFLIAATLASPTARLWIKNKESLKKERGCPRW